MAAGPRPGSLNAVESNSTIPPKETVLMKATTVSLAFNPDNYLGESPLWPPHENALYWINCENPPQIHCWRPEQGTHVVWPLQQRVGGIVLGPGGNLVVALSDGLYDFNTQTGGLTLRAPSPLPQHISLHECQCDRQGRLWVGSYNHQFTAENRDVQGGFIFRLDDDTLVPVINNIRIANGMAFSPQGNTMYMSDSPTRTVDAFDLDPATGELSNRRQFLQLQDGEGFVDGATVDALGGYWLAAVGAGALRRYLSDGRLDRVIPLPASNPTKPAFGGKNFDTLFVTTTRMEIGVNSEANGGIYALHPGEHGIPETGLAASATP
jgi:sugar lactone lactonase YvrE